MIRHKSNRAEERIGNTGQYERCEELARYLIANNSTVRETAVRFGISKSTVHKDVTARLGYINPGLHAEVHDLFEKNKSERHLRGGEATRKKYIKNKACNRMDFMELQD